MFPCAEWRLCAVCRGVCVCVPARGVCMIVGASGQCAPGDARMMKAPADGAGLASSRMVAGSCLRRIAAGFARHKSKRLIVVAVGVALVLAIVSGARIGEYLQRRAARQRSRNAKVWRVAARDACVVRAPLADG